MNKTRFFLILAVLTAISATVATTPAGAKAKVSKPTAVPYVQYYETTFAQAGAYLPKGGYAVIELKLTGSASLTSIRVNNPDGRLMSGLVEYNKNVINITKGLPYVEFNCTKDGQSLQLGAAPTVCPVIIAPGNYPKGLEITITDAVHRMMKHSVPAGEFAAGSTTPLEIAYTPDPDILFYEAFDTFVWGGDYVKGMSQPGFTPVAGFMTDEFAKTVTGYEDAYLPSSYNLPGSTFFQSNDYTKALTNPIAKAEGNLMTEKYLRSRGMWDWQSGFRCMEHPGYVGIGTDNRGMLRTPRVAAIEGIRSVTVSFDFAVKAGFTNELLVQLKNGGYITSATMDGKKLELDKTQLRYSINAAELILTKNEYVAAKSAFDPKQWHHVELAVDRATDGLDITFWTNILKNPNHAFFVDNIIVRNGPEMERGDLRVLYWNIQNGMWYDQPNNYDNFVKWVKKFDPDVCVWCEASSIYTDNTSTKSETRYLPGHWDELAARYGHQYSALGEYCDNYPQEMTSKYPITTLKKIGATEVPNHYRNGKGVLNVAHGVGVHSIEVNGKTITFVTMHTWPQKFAWGLPDKEKATRDASAARKDGDLYREFEMKYVVDHTINAPEFAGTENWLLMGDLNSRSRADKWHFKSTPADSTIYKCQDAIRNNSNMLDIIAETYPGDFMSSTYGNGRIDNMYASPAMFARVKNAMILIDGWTAAYGYPTSPYVKSFCEPSDHRPILVDFVFDK